MKRSLLGILALVIGCAGGVVIRDIVVPARAQGAPGPVFEYQVVSFQDAVAGYDGKEEFQQRLHNLMNRFGSQGFRYVGFATPSTGYRDMIAFERPRFVGPSVPTPAGTAPAAPPAAGP